MTVTLRPYQREALDRTTAAEERGVRAQMGVAAVGLGKTVMFASLAKERGGRTLILAHRDELIAQAAAQVQAVWPEADIGIVKAERDENYRQVVIASVQTLAREHRLDGLLDHGGMFHDDPFDLVVIDEAHHAAADTYRAIIDRLGAGTDDGPLLLGVTATPDRGDGQGLDDVFDEITWNYDMQWGIRAGYLSDVRGLRISLPKLDLGRIKKSRGDYQAGSAGVELSNADGPEQIVKAWQEHASDRRTLVFVPTVAVAAETRDAFEAAGVSAGMVHGGTPIDERRADLAAFENGDIQVMVNVMVLTEGYDNPRIDCVVIARPTRSRGLYCQMTGRGTRRHPEKQDLLVLDVVGVTDDLSLVTVPSLFGIPEDSPFADGLTDGTATATGAADAHDDHLVAIGQMKAERAEMFRKIRGAGIAWVPVGDVGDGFVCSIGEEGIVWVARLGEDWMAWHDPKKPDAPTRTLIADTTLELAQGTAEDFLRSRNATGLVNAEARWRAGRASPKQLQLASKLKIDTSGMTKGEVSDAISAKFAERDLARMQKEATR